MTKILCILAVCTVLSGTYTLPPPAKKMLSGPILYGVDYNGLIYKIDVMSCTICPIFQATGYSNGVSDLVVLPDGNILLQAGNGLRLYDPPNQAPIWSDNTFATGSILAPNGLVYLSSNLTLSVFDPMTNTITVIGNWPPGITVNELYYQGGVLYGIAVDIDPPYQQRIIEVNVANPELSVTIVPIPPINFSGGTTSNGYTTSISPGNILWQYNTITNTLSNVCVLNVILSGLSDLPPNVPEEPCLCLTDAGSLNTVNYNVCVPGSVTVPFNNDAILDGNDILRYILFSNPSDTLGSIIAQSSSATLNFNPATMQTGIVYYLATLAGDNLNGSVDLTDPCLDISNAVQVIWRPRPTVSFSVGNPNVCPGNCIILQVNLTGTTPITITGNILSGGTVIGTFNQVYTNNTGELTICVPPNTPLGSVTVQATSVLDAWCSCN